MTISKQPGDQNHQAVDGVTMARMLDLTHVFELIMDDLDDDSLA